MSQQMPRAGPQVCHAHSAMPVGMCISNAEGSAVEVQVMPAGAGGGRRWRSGQGSGDRLQKGTSMSCPSPPQPWWDELQWASRPYTHHTGSHWLGTVPKGQSGRSEKDDQEGGSGQRASSRTPEAAGLGPCPGVPPLPTALRAAAPGGGATGKPESSRRGVRRGNRVTGQKPASQHPLFKL